MADNLIKIQQNVHLSIESFRQCWELHVDSCGVTWNPCGKIKNPLLSVNDSDSEAGGIFQLDFSVGLAELSPFTYISFARLFLHIGLCIFKRTFL